LINNQLKGDKARKSTALEELWKAQDSGIFRLASPGLFHAPVRKAAYASLIEAEKITREKRKFTASLSVFDFDLDGEMEYVFQDEKLNCCVKTRGACVFELDYLPAAWNYLDTLALDAAYPKLKEMRCAFMDWLAPAGTLDADRNGISGGRFCGREEYEVTEIDRPQRRVTFTLPPKRDLPWGEIEIGKTWQLEKNVLHLEYVLRNSGPNSLAFVFGPSLDLSFPGEDGFRVNSFQQGGKESVTLNGDGLITNAAALEFMDIKNETLLSLELNQTFNGKIFNIRSGVSGQEEYQSTCVTLFFPLKLAAGETWKAAFSLRLNS
jgi:hypothetical protein